MVTLVYVLLLSLLKVSDLNHRSGSFNRTGAMEPESGSAYSRCRFISCVQRGLLVSFLGA
jgi:hypothetical protein